MNVFDIIFLIILLQNINSIQSSICNNTEYWCHKASFRIKYSDLGFVNLTQSEYKDCVLYCQQNMTCKAFEYNTLMKNCKFTSKWFDNVKEAPRTQEVFRKKSSNKACFPEIYEGRGHSFDRASQEHLQQVL